MNSEKEEDHRTPIVVGQSDNDRPREHTQREPEVPPLSLPKQLLWRYHIKTCEVI